MTKNPFIYIYIYIYAPWLTPFFTSFNSLPSLSLSLSLPLSPRNYFPISWPLQNFNNLNSKQIIMPMKKSSLFAAFVAAATATATTFSASSLSSSCNSNVKVRQLTKQFWVCVFSWIFLWELVSCVLISVFLFLGLALSCGSVIDSREAWDLFYLKDPALYFLVNT